LFRWLASVEMISMCVDNLHDSVVHKIRMMTETTLEIGDVFLCAGQALSRDSIVNMHILIPVQASALRKVQ
jgi:hypothetical protein